MMFLVFYMATILSGNREIRDQKYLAYQAPGLSLCHTSPNLRANTHGTHFHSNFKTGIDMFIGPRYTWGPIHGSGCL